MDKVYQVFVSSTFTDLQAERKQVSDTLAKSGFIPSGMELFPAADQQQLEFIKRVIDRCDYYVVIIGARYGSIDGDKSYTEKEYEYAVEKKIPILAFLHGDPSKIESGKADHEPDQIKRLEQFRRRLQTSRIVAFWQSANDLRTEVLTAVTNAVNLTPGIGWVRGDQAVDVKVLQEAEKLRIENDELKARLSNLEGAEISFPPHLSGPEDELDLQISYYEARDEKTAPAKLTPRVALENSVDDITKEISEGYISRHLATAYFRNAYPDSYSSKIIYRMSANSIRQLRFQLEALGLVKAESREGDSGKYIAWALTDKGRQYINNLYALPKKANS